MSNIVKDVPCTIYQHSYMLDACVICGWKAAGHPWTALITEEDKALVTTSKTDTLTETLVELIEEIRLLRKEIVDLAGKIQK